MKLETLLLDHRDFSRKRNFICYLTYLSQPTYQINQIITICLVITNMFKNQLQISTTSLWKHAIGNFSFKGTKNYTLKGPCCGFTTCFNLIDPVSGSLRYKSKTFLTY